MTCRYILTTTLEFQSLTSHHGATATMWCSTSRPRATRQITGVENHYSGKQNKTTTGSCKHFLLAIFPHALGSTTSAGKPFHLLRTNHLHNLLFAAAIWLDRCLSALSRQCQRGSIKSVSRNLAVSNSIATPGDILTDLLLIAHHPFGVLQGGNFCFWENL